MNGNDMAFPVLDRSATPNDTLQLGLTKREYFAALVMQGILANEQAHPLGVADGVTHCAYVAVRAADALLKALNTKPSPWHSEPGEPISATEGAKLTHAFAARLRTPKPEGE